MAVAGAMAKSYRVVLCSGGPIPPELQPPAGVELLAMAPLGTGSGGRLSSLDPAVTLEEAWASRRSSLLALVHECNPVAVVVELFPFGRRKFAAEVLALLSEARTLPRPPVIVCSVRDLLVTGHPEKQQHDDEAAVRLNEYFDAVIVHADPRFARLEDTFCPNRPIHIPTLYTGFVSAESTRPMKVERTNPLIMVSAGGGKVGSRLLTVAAEAHRTHFAARGFDTRIAGGPFLPAETLRALKAAEADDLTLEIEQFVPDLCSAMASSSISISQCGYNTAMDIIRAGVPAVVVPYDDGGETEQWQRAERLSRLGVCTPLRSSELTADRLAATVFETLGSVPARTDLSLDGASETTAIIEELVGRTTTSADSIAS